jgi:hypothetical protein
MLDERLATWLLGADASTRDNALRGLLSALWSFLQHPAVRLEDHLTAVEERLKALETRLVGDLQTVVDTGVVAVEETIAGVEHRLEQDFERTVRGRVAGIQARLEAVKTRVVEDLKHELHRLVLLLALVVGCAGLALVGMIFGLMAAWTYLRNAIGAAGASLVLALIFLVASVVVFGLLRLVLNRTPPQPGAPKIAT